MANGPLKTIRINKVNVKEEICHMSGIFMFTCGSEDENPGRKASLYAANISMIHGMRQLLIEHTISVK